MNREQWLTEVGKLLEPLFLVKSFKIKQAYKLTCGWPCQFARSMHNRRVGECHSYKVSAAGVCEVFISPVIDDPAEVAGTVCHELIHVSVGNQEGHKGKFRTACRYLGMSGRPTCAMPGTNLADQIAKLIEPLGVYPHKAIKVETKLVKVPPKSVKLECPCGCYIRITEENLEQYGSPVCGCGLPFVVEEEE